MFSLSSSSQTPFIPNLRGFLERWRNLSGQSRNISARILSGELFEDQDDQVFRGYQVHKCTRVPENMSIEYLFENLILLIWSEMGTFEWWRSGLRLDPLFFLISRLNSSCSPLAINLQINWPIWIKDISF